MAGRFVIERVAGQGGMGTVYRAKDTFTGERVALKLLRAPAEEGAVRRFTREIELLASLSHPGIVSYVAHGLTETKEPYLAMEWLDGEDLAQRLSRQGLKLSETLAMLRSTALALSVAHAHGVVHRDLKPSNIFLRDGRIDEVVILDFGVARHVVSAEIVTRTGAMVGTLEYMAPEQAESARTLTPRADIFSLGCVLYECVTGRSPFAASHLAAVLAKILFAEPPPLTSVLPDTPTWLQALLDRMLAKDPARRIVDATALAAELVDKPEVALLEFGGPPRSSRARYESHVRLGGAEQQLVSVVLAAPPMSAPDDPTLDLGPMGQRILLPEEQRAALASHHAWVEPLADGSLVITIPPGRGGASAQAELAARAALSLKEQWPDAAIALATGRGVVSEQLPVGDALDRAAELLGRLEHASSTFDACVIADELSADLLDARFEIRRAPNGDVFLYDERTHIDESRLLLGKPTPCVGREHELSSLERTFNACVEEGIARALVVVAPAGAGKSRLRHELLRRIQKQEREISILSAWGDPMSGGSSYGLLGQAVRRLCDVHTGEELTHQRTKLHERIGRNLDAAEEEVNEVVAFMGELCGVPFPDDQSPRLGAARCDPRLMSENISHALVSFLRAECARTPVLVVLEDLHWSDTLTIKLVEEAIRELSECPLMVLALARPEVEEVFAGSRAQRFEEIHLRPLSKKASAQLIREVLGAELASSQVERIIEQASGNALFLEELIRLAAEGRAHALPETALAILQARILRLRPGVRRALLAASILGQRFSSGGVHAILSADEDEPSVEPRLEELVALEIIERQKEPRFSNPREYGFRHVLVRDAAYGLVQERYRQRAHRLAATFLEEIMGERDALVLAEHYHLGGAKERAASLYVVAAHELFEQHDLKRTRRCIDAALACGASGEEQNRLRALDAAIAFWMDDFGRSLEIGRSALSCLAMGSYPWCKLISTSILASAFVGRHDELSALGRMLLSANPDTDARTAYVEAVCYLSNMTVSSGGRNEAQGFLARMDAIGKDLVDKDPVARAWMSMAHAWLGHFLGNRPWQTWRDAERSADAFRQIGSHRNLVAPESLAGLARATLGDTTGAAETLRESLRIAQRTGQIFPISYAKVYMALALASSVDPSHREEAHTLASEEVSTDNPNLLQVGMAFTALANVALRRGALEEAESMAQRAYDRLAPFPPYRLFASRALSVVLIARGHAQEARGIAEQATQAIVQMGSGGAAEVGAHLSLAEARLACGDARGGEAALRASVDALYARAADIPEPAARERFLHHVPENARAIELAHELPFGLTRGPS